MSNIPVADAHCDFLYDMTQDGWDINRPTPVNQAVALPYIKQGGGKLLFFAAWVDMDMRKDCLQQALDMFDSYFNPMMEETTSLCPSQRITHAAWSQPPCLPLRVASRSMQP